MKLDVSLDMRGAPCRWVALVLQRTRARGLSSLLHERDGESVEWPPRQAGRFGGARRVPRPGQGTFPESEGLLFAHAPLTLGATTL